MPAYEFPKLKQHPIRELESSTAVHAASSVAYAELCVTSNYTFLTGASHPEEFVSRAGELGYRAVAVTDVNTVAGVVRAHVAAKDAGMRFVLGCCLRLQDMARCGVHVYPTGMDSYRRLCRLLTIGKRRAEKGSCLLEFKDLVEHAEGLLCVVAPDALAGEEWDVFESDARRLKSVFDDDRLSVAVSVSFGPDDEARLGRLFELSSKIGAPCVATNAALYHAPERRMLHDVVTCIRQGCTLSQAGFRLAANSERHLKPPEEMARLFRGTPGVLRRGIEIVERTVGFSLDQLRYEYPDEVVPPGRTAQEHLTGLAWSGAERIYAGAVPGKVRAQIEHELRLIEELRYATYFLTVHDLVRFARTGVEREGGPLRQEPWDPILCQGRGAAANSAVCFCIGVTSVDPARANLLFERFISRERNEPPDIDIDFEHERREEVIQYIYRKYGRDRAALTAEVITYRRRSAVRDVGKVLGLSLDLVDRLAKDIEWFDRGVLDAKYLKSIGLNPADPTLLWLAKLVNELLGFPRHLSQHVGGFVITRSPLCELVPVENAAMPDRTVIEWDKDDIDAMGMLKVDVLGLGMLSALRKCLEMVNRHRGTEAQRHKVGAQDTQGQNSEGQPTSLPPASHSVPLCLSASVPLSLATIPPEDPATYEMIQHADTVGVFQIESRAQMSMLPRLKPREFYDLVIEVAIVRPGPIQGGMVHPYLKRRSGEETAEPLPAGVPDRVRRDVNEVLGRTLGVPLFQEQCIALAVKAAGFTPGKADQLRRAMAAWKRKGDQIHRFGQELIDGMKANGLPEEFARRCFEQIKGFSEYGFPESHAASFALLVYASAWLKRHYPAEFCAALLNSQPMGFYAPAQLIRDAKEHGVGVLGVDVNYSAWDCEIVEGGTLRLGMRMVSGLGLPDAEKIRGAIASGGRAGSMLSLWRRSGASARAMRRLASADAFGSMGLSRQEALWQARLLRDEPLPLFDRAGTGSEPALEAIDADGLGCLPTISPYRQVALDYESVGLSLRAHPVSFSRERLSRMGALACADLRDAAKTPEGALVTVAGLVLVRQRPGTANDVTFITLEDETGIANLIVWKRVYSKYRREARANLLVATGRVQRQGEVVHLTVTKMSGEDASVPGLAPEARNFH